MNCEHLLIFHRPNYSDLSALWIAYTSKRKSLGPFRVMLMKQLWLSSDSVTRNYLYELFASCLAEAWCTLCTSSPFAPFYTWHWGSFWVSVGQASLAVIKLKEKGLMSGRICLQFCVSLETSQATAKRKWAKKGITTLFFPGGKEKGNRNYCFKKKKKSKFRPWKQTSLTLNLVLILVFRHFHA